MPEILLIQPPSTLQKLQRIKSRRPEMEAPLPFVCIGPYLIDAGFDVRVFDLRIDGVRTLSRHLSRCRPLIAGLSVMPGSMLRDTIHLTRLIKKMSPETRTVWGGTFPTLHHRLCLQIGELDYVVCGDGEETLTELARALQSQEGHESVDGVRGLAFRRDGEVHTTAARPPVDLDRHPIGAWHLLDRYMPYYLGPSGLISINTARGCPYTCTFCYNTAIYRGFNRYRTRSPEVVLEEVEYLVRRHAPRSLIFMDDDFLANRRRGIDLLGRIHTRYPALRFRIDARADEIEDNRATTDLAAQGLESVFFGVEGVSGEFLTRIRKGQESASTIEAAKVCARNGIQGTYSFTCGYPDESRSDLQDRVAMASLLRSLHTSSRSQIEIISPVIGTPLYGDLVHRDLVPEQDIEGWCRFSDWKCASGKGWIADGRFYEAFQLAFYLAFSGGSSLDGGLRTMSRMLSAWSRYRISRGLDVGLPEFRAGNFLLKKLIWGVADERDVAAPRHLATTS